MKNQIVVIEDDRDILDIIEYILADEGYTVSKFDHLVKIETLTRLGPSVILLDNKLADGFGNTLCLLIKSQPKARDIPVILVSASGSLPQLAERCHADGYLSKPFDIEDLLQIVKRHSKSVLAN
jgi:two-component system, OmpR family, phosphate regulon response regulator PhoB